MKRRRHGSQTDASGGCSDELLSLHRRCSATVRKPRERSPSQPPLFIDSFIQIAAALRLLSFVGKQKKRNDATAQQTPHASSGSRVGGDEEEMKSAVVGPPPSPSRPSSHQNHSLTTSPPLLPSFPNHLLHSLRKQIQHCRPVGVEVVHRLRRRLPMNLPHRKEESQPQQPCLSRREKWRSRF